MNKSVIIVILFILVAVIGFVFYYVNQANKEIAESLKNNEEPSNLNISFGLS